jgi:Zn-dependent protease with chaperone function
MMPSPVAEALLVVLAGVVGAWLLTYLAHSTLAIAGAAIVTRARPAAPIDRARIWRFAIVAPFATSALHVSGLAGASPFSWEIGALLPQSLVDWRLGIAGLSLLVVAAVTVPAGWVSGALVLRRVLGRRRPAPASVQNEIAALASVLGCRVPRVTFSDRAVVPAAVGLSEVCVPATALDAMSAEERRSLLAHEVGHLVARDPAWLVIAGSLSRLAPFQPLNRWAITQLRAASEEAADDFSVRATGDPLPLASALAGLASMLLVLPGGAAASGSPVVARVARLLEDRPPPSRWRRRHRRVAAALACAAMLVGAPGLRASVDDVANRLPWLAPSRAEPNARMLEVRRFERALRDTIRRALR